MDTVMPEYIGLCPNPRGEVLCGRLHDKGQNNRKCNSEGVEPSGQVHVQGRRQKNKKRKRKTKVIDSSSVSSRKRAGREDTVCLSHTGYMVILMKAILNANDMSITYVTQFQP